MCSKKPNFLIQIIQIKSKKSPSIIAVRANAEEIISNNKIIWLKIWRMSFFTIKGI